jgi:hypothetical protein
MKKEVFKVCELCNCDLVWGAHGSVGGLQECPNNFDGWPICKECMIDHCIHANCMVCNYGKYPDCKFLDMKMKYRI